jgi:hypothetical protein
VGTRGSHAVGGMLNHNIRGPPPLSYHLGFIFGLAEGDRLACPTNLAEVRAFVPFFINVKLGILSQSYFPPSLIFAKLFSKSAHVPCHYLIVTDCETFSPSKRED